MKPVALSASSPRTALSSSLLRPCRPLRLYGPVAKFPSTNTPTFAPSRDATIVHATKTDKPQYQPKSARDAIETADRVFKQQNDYIEAVRLYQLSLEMKPNDDEARAALYNMGCALTKMQQYKAASDCIMRAINDYSLKLAVALKVCM